MAKIKRLGVIKTASFFGLYGVLVGFISGLFLTLVSSLISTYFNRISSSVYEGNGTSISFGFGWLNLLVFPVVFGLVSFITGLIFTPITNLILRIIGGIDADIEISGAQNQPPQSIMPQLSNVQR